MIRKVIAREREGMAPPQNATRTEDDGTAGRLLGVIAGLLAELHPGAAGPAASLDSSFDRELALDSLSRVELIARVEAAFSVALPETVLGSAATPRELLRAIMAAQAAPGRRSGPPPAAMPVAPAARTTGLLPHQAETLIEALAHHAAADPDRPHIRFYADDGDGAVLTYGGSRRRPPRRRRLKGGGLVPARRSSCCCRPALTIPRLFGVQMAGGSGAIYPPPPHPDRGARAPARRPRRNCRAAAMITDVEARRLGRCCAPRSGPAPRRPRHQLTRPQHGGCGALRCGGRRHSFFSTPRAAPARPR